MQTVTISSDTVIVSGRVHPEVAEAIRLEAYRQRLSKSKMVALAIRFYLESIAKQENKHDISK